MQIHGLPFAPARRVAAAALVGAMAGTFASPPAFGQAPPAAARLAMLAGATAVAGSVRHAPRFVYTATGKRLTDVLRDFAASQSVPAVVAEGIEGVVTASFDISPRGFLDAMSKAYGILWYQDGAAYYFYPAKSIQGRLFRLKGYSRDSSRNEPLRGPVGSLEHKADPATARHAQPGEL